MAVSMIGPKFYAFDREGKPLAFGKLYTYEARTNTPKPTYQSEDQIVANTNPVIFNGEGYANIYLSGSYKMALKDSDDNEIWSADPISEANGADSLSYVLTAYYVSSTSVNVLGDHSEFFSEGSRIEFEFLGHATKQSTVLSASYDGTFTTVLIEDAIIYTDVKTAAIPNGFSSLADFNRESTEQLNAQEIEFQERFSPSKSVLPWEAGVVIADSLQQYSTGTIGESGYSVFLGDPLQMPFTTSATFAEDEALDRWTESTQASREWTTIEAIARSLNTPNSNVMYSTQNTIPIVGFIYDETDQINYSVPEQAQGKFISSVVLGVLTTTDLETYTLEGNFKWASIESISRSLNIKNSDVIYTTDISNPIPAYLYDAVNQVSYSVPQSAWFKTIKTVIGDQLTTTDDFVYTLESSFKNAILQGVAGALSTTTDNVMYSTDVSNPIVGFIYDAVNQVTYEVPPDALGLTIDSVIGDQLTTTSPDPEVFTLTKSSSLRVKGDGGTLTQSFEEVQNAVSGSLEMTTENYLKANQNLNVPSGTETLPSSTPTDYLAGAEIAYNLYAETDVTGLVVDGTISATSGTIYMSYEGDFSSLPYGGQMPDGSISQTGFDIDYNVRKAGYTTVAVDLSLADAFEFFVLTPAAGRCARINNKESALACGEDGLTLDILSLSTYTSGTYSLPSGLNWDDFYRVDMMVGLSPTAVEATGQLTKAMLNSSWSTLNIVTDGGENAFITRVSDTSFSVGRAGSRAVLQAIGKLNTGVL